MLPVKEEITLGPPSKKVKSENEAAAVFHIPQDKFTAKLPDPFPLPTNFLLNYVRFGSQGSAASSKREILWRSSTGYLCNEMLSHTRRVPADWTADH